MRGGEGDSSDSSISSPSGGSLVDSGGNGGSILAGSSEVCSGGHGEVGSGGSSEGGSGGNGGVHGGHWCWWWTLCGRLARLGLNETVLYL